jgi:hypothetical protein
MTITEIDTRLSSLEAVISKAERKIKYWHEWLYGDQVKAICKRAKIRSPRKRNKAAIKRKPYRSRDCPKKIIVERGAN